jgi:hypothetical protein
LFEQSFVIRVQFIVEAGNGLLPFLQFPHQKVYFGLEGTAHYLIHLLRRVVLLFCGSGGRPAKRTHTAIRTDCVFRRIHDSYNNTARNMAAINEVASGVDAESSMPDEVFLWLLYYQNTEIVFLTLVFK